jgi:hypothetical protein
MEDEDMEDINKNRRGVRRSITTQFSLTLCGNNYGRVSTPVFIEVETQP